MLESAECVGLSITQSRGGLPLLRLWASSLRFVSSSHLFAFFSTSLPSNSRARTIERRRESGDKKHVFEPLNPFTTPWCSQLCYDVSRSSSRAMQSPDIRTVLVSAAIT